MIPEDWEDKPFGELCISSQYGLSVSSDPDGEVPIIGMKDMSGGKVLGEKWARVSISAIERKVYRLNEGDLLLNRTNSPDLVGKVSRWDRNEEAVFASYIVRFVTDPKIADSRFLNYHLNSNRGQGVLKSISTRGVSQANINPTVFKEAYFVALPPLPEQRRIAALLDAWDDAIAAAEKLLAAKERRICWLRAKVLTGKVRLPDFTQPWQTAPISKVLTEHGETSTGREEVHSVSVHQGLINQIEHLGRSFAAASTDHYNRVLPGDIVYTKSPTGDFPLGIIKQSRLDKAAIVSPLYGVFTPTSRELGTIMDTLFASPAAAERLLAPVVQKGAKNTIAVTNKNFLKAQLCLPTDKREIVALSELVEAARAELDVHQADLKLLRNQKRGLMQKLLTGQWRVPESVDVLLPGASEVAT